MMRLTPVSAALIVQMVARPADSSSPPKTPRPNAKLKPAAAEMTKLPKAATTNPKRMAPTTTSSRANMTMSGLATPAASKYSVAAQQMATPSSHNPPSPKCSMNCARLCRLNATSMGPTSSTPAVVLLHQRSQRRGFIARTCSPVR
jgi:hypothetical protein